MAYLPILERLVAEPEIRPLTYHQGLTFEWACIWKKYLCWPGGEPPAAGEGGGAREEGLRPHRHQRVPTRPGPAANMLQ